MVAKTGNVNTDNKNSFIDSESQVVRAVSLIGSLPASWDKIQASYAATTDTYVYSLGVDTLKTMVITYTDATKATIDKVEVT